MVTAALLAAGCGRSSSDGTGAPVAAKPAPEQSFDLIMATFKRRIEDAPSGFVAPQAGGHSRMIASNEVTSKVLPPAKDGEPYRAEVTVASRSRYSLQRSIDESEDTSKKKDERKEQRSNADSLENPGNVGKGVDILDPGLVSPSGEGPNRRGALDPAESVVSRRVDEEKRTFELEYQNGRWALMTKTDPETERSIQSAFEEALATQI
jgi:hypothetical protein